MFLNNTLVSLTAMMLGAPAAALVHLIRRLIK